MQQAFKKARAAQTSLARTIALVLGIIFSLSLAVALLSLNAILDDDATSQINNQARFIMDSMLAVREYTSTLVNPIIAPINNESLEFHPEAVPSYSATTVFSLLKKDPNYGSYAYREATLNPTNLKDKADAIETAIIEEFRANPTLKAKSGYRDTPLGSFHYIARPIKISKASCLACHSDPSLAPKSQLLTYGKTNGYGWKLGETVGAQIVTVPIDAIYRSKWHSLTATSLLIFAAFIAAGAATSAALQKIILDPIRKISARADQASIDPKTVDFHEKSRRDEIGSIARSLERLKQSLIISMKMLNEAKNRDS